MTTGVAAVLNAPITKLTIDAVSIASALANFNSGAPDSLKELEIALGAAAADIASTALELGTILKTPQFERELHVLGVVSGLVAYLDGMQALGVDVSNLEAEFKAQKIDVELGLKSIADATEAAAGGGLFISELGIATVILGAASPEIAAFTTLAASITTGAAAVSAYLGAFKNSGVIYFGRQTISQKQSYYSNAALNPAILQVFAFHRYINPGILLQGRSSMMLGAGPILTPFL